MHVPWPGDGLLITMGALSVIFVGQDNLLGEVYQPLLFYQANSLAGRKTTAVAAPVLKGMSKTKSLEPTTTTTTANMPAHAIENQVSQRAVSG